MTTSQIDEMRAEIDPDSEQALYAKIAYTLRESRKAMLNRYEVSDEAALLAEIRNGKLAEHPAYDHYLGARILEQMRLHLRAEMLARFGGVDAADTQPGVHLMLKEKLEMRYAHRLAEPVQMAQDALLLSFDNELTMEVRYFSAQEYGLHWRWGEAEMRIDTAPLHAERASHLHGEDGTILTDAVTFPGADPWSNLSRLLDRLLDNPLLDTPTYPDDRN